MSQTGKEGRRGATPRRAAIYTRFSSNLQSAESTDGQIAVCRRYAANNGFTVTKIYSDEAISGTSLEGRHGWHSLMADAEAGKFSIIIVEAIDRMNRNAGDWHREYERLEHFGIELHTTHGPVSFLEGGINALTSANFSRELGPKVHRGQSNNIDKGKLAGSFTYGYRKVPGYGGQPEIDPAKAEIVRRIFAESKAGATARQIAIDLNRDNVPGPRGGKWGGSTINGDVKRETGILHNALYVGRIVWNRADVTKAPGSKRRVAKLRHKSEWLTAERPALRIIDDATFAAAQKPTHIMRTTNRKRAKYLLSGLMRCGECGGGMAVNGADRSGRVYVRCSSYTSGSGCKHNRRYHLDEIENLSLSGLKAELAEPVLIRHYIDSYSAEAKRLAASAGTRAKKLNARKRDLEKSLKRYVDAIGDGSIPVRHVADKMASIESDLADVAAGLAEAEPRPIVLFPATAKNYLSKIEKLGSDTAARDPDSAAIIRDLLKSVTVIPVAKGGPVRLTLNGYLERLTAPRSNAPYGLSGGNVLTFP